MLLNANEGVLTSKKYFLMIVPKERQFLISCTDEWNCNKKKIQLIHPVYESYTHTQFVKLMEQLFVSVNYNKPWTLRSIC